LEVISDTLVDSPTPVIPTPLELASLEDLGSLWDRLQGLNWFYRLWITQGYVPSYELSYHVEENHSGGALLKGELSQKGLPEDETWFMPIPLAIQMQMCVPLASDSVRPSRSQIS
jgi:hypothetical protein